MKKRFILIAFLLMGLLVLAACSSPAPEEEAPADDAAEEDEHDEDMDMGGTLATVQDRGTLKCGVSGSLPGFSSVDADGNYVGFDVDYCKVVAAAVLGDADAVEYQSLTADQRFPALQTGEVDVLIRNTTWTLSRDTDLGLDFTTVTFYDGQGYMVRAADGFDSVEDLDGATICVTSGTTTELNLADDFARRGLDYTASVFSETADTHSTFISGACDAETSDKSQLAGLRSAEDSPGDYVVLADTISKEPLGPVVRANDSEWHDVVMWAVFATMEAEELGVNSGNVDDMMGSDNPRIEKLLGAGEDDLGALLGLDKDWAYNIIKLVGNYAEIYDAHIPALGITRAGSANAMWTEGGLLYSPAMR